MSAEPAGTPPQVQEALRLLGAGDEEEARRLLQHLVVDAREADDRSTEAHAYLALGNLERAASDNDAAQHAYKEARRLFLEEQQPGAAAGALVALAEIQTGLGHTDEAHGFYEQAVQLQRTAGDAEAEARTLIDVGDCRKRLGRQGAALEAYSSAGRTFKRLDISGGQGDAAYKIGELYQSANPEAAAHHFQRAAEFYVEADRRENPNPGMRLENPELPPSIEDCRLVDSWLMSKIARHHAEELQRSTQVRIEGEGERSAATGRNDLQRDVLLSVGVVVGIAALSAAILLIASGWAGVALSAAPIYRAAIALVATAAAYFAARTVGIQSRSVLAVTLAAVFATVFVASSRLLPAPAPLGVDPALWAQLDTRSAEPAGVARALLDLGRRAQEDRRLDEARLAYAQARALYRAVADRRGEVQVIVAAGDLEKEFGAPAAALELFTEALGIYRDLADAGNELALLRETAALQRSLGQDAAALAAYRRALELQEQLGDSSGRAALLESAGDVARTLGQLDEARSAYTEALALYRSAQNTLAQSDLQLRFSRLEEDARQFDRARARAQDAYAIAMQRGEPSRQARARLQLGHVEATAANPDRARRAYEEAISLSAADDRMTEAEAVQSLGQLARQENKEDAARDHYTRARRLYIETGDRRGEASVCIALAQLEAAAGRPDEARSAYDAALGIYLQQGMQEAQGRTLLEIGDLEKGRGRTEQAQDAYTRALGAYRLRLDKSGQAKALDRLGDLVEGTDPSLSQRYRSQAASLRNELQRGNAAAGAAPR